MNFIPAFLRKVFSAAKAEENTPAKILSGIEKVSIPLSFLTRTVSHMKIDAQGLLNVEICAQQWAAVKKIFEDLAKNPTADPKCHDMRSHLNAIEASIQVSHDNGTCLIRTNNLLYIHNNMDFLHQVRLDFCARANHDPEKIVSLFGEKDPRNSFAYSKQKAGDIENFRMGFRYMMENAVLSKVDPNPAPRVAPSVGMPRSGQHFRNP